MEDQKVINPLLSGKILCDWDYRKTMFAVYWALKHGAVLGDECSDYTAEGHDPRKAHAVIIRKGRIIESDYRYGFSMEDSPDLTDIVFADEKNETDAPMLHGKWERIGYSSKFRCSVCGEETGLTYHSGPRWKFCPMCGARMDKKEGSSNAVD